MQLPVGLVHRPLTLSDASGVVEVMGAEELANVGRVIIEEADIVGDWQRPSFDVGASTMGVFDDDRLLGYAEIIGPGRGDAAVHPDHHDRGIGSWLATWMQDHARATGHRDIGMPVAVGSPGEALLRSLGYEARWNSWALVMPQGRDFGDQPLPVGYSIRVGESDADRHAAWHVIEDAFLEWSARDKQPYDDWAATVVGRPGFEPWNLRLVVAPDGEVVGGVHVVLADDAGYVAKIAVRKDQRGRGLARAAPVEAFREARAHGALRSELATDSRTGAPSTSISRSAWRSRATGSTWASTCRAWRVRHQVSTRPTTGDLIR
jgi:mycothiol synthase